MPTEDSQPNESRILPKGAGVPVIRTTKPKPSPLYKHNYYRNGPRPQPSRFQGSRNTRNINATHSFPRYPHHTSQNAIPHQVPYDTRLNSQSYQNFQSRSSVQPKNHARRTDHLPFISPAVPSMNTFKAQPRAQPGPDFNRRSVQAPPVNYRGAYSTMNERVNTKPNKKWKGVNILSDPNFHVHGMACDEVPNFHEEDAFSLRQLRPTFGTQTTNSPKERDVFVSQQRLNITITDVGKANMPSGSNAKLEDLIKKINSVQPSTSLVMQDRSPLASRMPINPAEVRQNNADTHDEPAGNMLYPQNLKHARPFRSGNLTLTYGPPRISVRPLSPPMRLSPLPEVIDVGCTSPLYAKQEEKCTAKDNEAATSASNDSAEIYLEEDTADVLRLPRRINDKPRRILVSRTQNLSFVASMHGRQQELYTPDDADKESVDDICLLATPYDSIAVIAQAREENALSLLYLVDNVPSGSKPRIIPVGRTSLDRDRLLRGVSAVAPLPFSNSSLSFVSAGYDHIVHLWSLDVSLSFPPISGILNVRHTSVVQSLLAVSDTTPKLLSAGADCCVHVYDLPSERTLSTIRTSNSAYQLHGTVRPECVLLEVAHRDSQFELFDYRALTGRPAQRFGFESSQLQGRFNRGDVDTQGGTDTFVSGGRDGQLRLWDLRNPGKCKQEIMCFPDQKIAQAKFNGNNVVVISDDNRVMFFNTVSSYLCEKQNLNTL